MVKEENLLKSHAVNKETADVIVLQGNHGPVGKTDHLLGDSLNPDLKKRKLAADGTDGDLVDVAAAQVGLVEHVRVGVKSHQVTNVHATGVIKQVAEGSSAGGCVDPLLERARLSVAVVVDGGGPAGDDGQAGVAVGGDVGDGGPEGALGVAQDGARVVADDVADAVVKEGLDGVAVEQTGDGGRDQTGRGEHGRGAEADLVEPGLVEVDLLVGVAVGGVVKLLVREGVRDRGEGVEVVVEPRGDVVQKSALQGPGVVHVGGLPERDARAERLLEVQRRVGRGVVVDGLVRHAHAGACGLGDALDEVTVAVVAHLDEVVRARGQTRVDVGLPGGVRLEIGDADAEVVAGRVVDLGLEAHVVDLGGQIDLALADEQTAGHPVDEAVLEVVGGQGPVGGPRGEPYHLLASAKGVDDGRGGGGGEGAIGRRSKGGNGLGDGRVDDLGRVMPETLGAHAGAGLDVGGGEVRGVREGDELLDARVAAAGTGDSQVDAQVRAGEDVEADHADAEGGLVGVDGFPLGGGDGGAPAVGVLVRDLADDDDAAVVALFRAGGQNGEGDAGLGHEHDLVGDAIALQAFGSRSARVGVAGEDEDGVGE